MKIAPLDAHDVSILKAALRSYKWHVFFIFLGMIFCATVFCLINHTKDDLKDWPEWLLYLFPILAFISFLSAVHKTRDFRVDIQKNEKLVFTCNCKRTCDSGGDSSDVHYLHVEAYEKIELKSYDFDNVQYLFPEGIEVYCEIHIAPLSKTILQVRRY